MVQSQLMFYLCGTDHFLHQLRWYSLNWFFICLGQIIFPFIWDGTVSIDVLFVWDRSFSPSVEMVQSQLIFYLFGTDHIPLHLRWYSFGWFFICVGQIISPFSSDGKVSGWSVEGVQDVKKCVCLFYWLVQSYLLLLVKVDVIYVTAWLQVPSLDHRCPVSITSIKQWSTFFL